MSPPVSASFTRLIETLNAMGAEANKSASDTETYRTGLTISRRKRAV